MTAEDPDVAEAGDGESRLDHWNLVGGIIRAGVLSLPDQDIDLGHLEAGDGT